MTFTSQNKIKNNVEITINFERRLKAMLKNDSTEIISVKNDYLLIIEELFVCCSRR